MDGAHNCEDGGLGVEAQTVCDLVEVLENVINSK